MRRAACTLLVATIAWPAGRAPASPTVVVNDDGGWCWFQAARALLVEDKPLVGSVAAGTRDPARRGDVELTVVEGERRSMVRSEDDAGRR